MHSGSESGWSVWSDTVGSVSQALSSNQRLCSQTLLRVNYSDAETVDCMENERKGGGEEAQKERWSAFTGHLTTQLKCDIISNSTAPNHFNSLMI